MRWNLTYCLMIVSALTALLFTVHGAGTLYGIDHRRLDHAGIDRVSAAYLRPSELPAESLELLAVQQAPGRWLATTENEQIDDLFGMPRAEVETRLGAPLAKSDDQRYWTYPTRVVVFSNDVVRGFVESDAAVPGQPLAEAFGPTRVRDAAASGKNIAARTLKPKAASSRKPKTAGREYRATQYRRSSSIVARKRFSKPDWLRAWGRERDRIRRENSDYARNRRLRADRARFDARGRTGSSR